MNKWEIPNFQTIRYIKLSILAVTYLVTGLDKDPITTLYLVGWIE